MSASRSYDYAASTARDAAGTIGREVAGTVGRSASNALLFAPTTAAMSLPFAAYLLTLSHRVIRARKSTNTLIGEHSSATGGTDPLYIAVRAHQNYLETVPTGLLLALLAELNGANRRVLAYALAGLWVLRVVNVEAGLRAEGTTGVGRKIGYYGTHTWIGAMAAWCVHLTRDYWGY